MADGDGNPWHLPREVRGGDVRLGGTASPLSAEGKARLLRIVTRAPEAMVKVTGRARGGATALRAHLDYITRGGRLALETGDGARITDRAGMRALEEDWVLANAVEARGPAVPHAAQSVALTLSMPPGTPADLVEEAARAWAQETFGGTHDWAMARHDDRGHPHVHVTVRAVGRDGRRLAPGPADLRAWRERFARELRERGVEAEATPRQVRGVTRKGRGAAVERIVERGGESRVLRAEGEAMERSAISADRSDARARVAVERHEALRLAYLGHAEALERGDAGDRALARDVRRFVAEMPAPLTRVQARAAEVRRSRTVDGGVSRRQELDMGGRGQVQPEPSRCPVRALPPAPTLSRK